MREEVKDNLIILHPNGGEWSATIVFTHGLGDSNLGWIDTVRDWARMMPWVKFYVPTAPTIPITLNGGYKMTAWFDLTGLTAADADKCAGLDKSVSYVESLLDADHALGLPYNRMVLGGFSQGAALSLYTGLIRGADKKLAGVVALSGFMPNSSSFGITGSETVPVFQSHGTGDQVVQLAWGEMTHQLLKAKGNTECSFKTYPGLPHSINQAVLTDVNAFLKRCLAKDETKCVAQKHPASMSVKELKVAIKEAGLERRAVGLSEKQELVDLLKDEGAQIVLGASK